MSEPKRYDNFQYETKGGEYVRYEDYARLREENSGLLAAVASHERVDNLTIAKLKAEVERLKNNCDYLDQKLDEEIDKSAMLCGQVERLTDAITSGIAITPDASIVP